MSTLGREAVAGARARLEPGGPGAIADTSGAFVIDRVAAGTYAMRVEALGYRTWRRTGLRIDPGDTLQLVITLEPEPIALSEIVVSPSRMSLLSGPQLSRSLDRERIARMPHLGDDLLRALARLPGVAGGDFSARLYVRGGEPRETAVRLDGVEVSDPFHFEDLTGIFSAIDPDALTSATLYSGGFPAAYGGRMSGVLDLRTGTAPAQPRTIVGVSALAARVLHEGVSRDGRQDWLFSARRGYLDLLIPLIDPSADIRPNYGDFFGRWRLRTNDAVIWSARARSSKDVLHFRGDTDDEQIDAIQRVHQGWIARESGTPGRGSSTTTLAFAVVERSRSGGFDGSDASAHVDDQRRADRYDLRHEVRRPLGTAAALETGLELGWDHARYAYTNERVVRDLIATGGGPPITTTIRAAPEPSAARGGAFVSLRARLPRGLIGELGVRADRQGGTDESRVEPRAQLSWRRAPLNLRAAWGLYGQPQGLDELQVEDGVLAPGRAERSEHRILSAELDLAGRSRLTLEAYDKRLSHLRPRYENLFDPIQLFPEAEPDRVRIAPSRGEASGVEILLERSAPGPVQGWVGIVFSRARDRVDGTWIPRAWDQRQALTWNLDLSPSRDWHLGLSGTAHDGWPTTPVFADTVHNANGTVGVRASPGALRSSRFPAYQRVDARLSRQWRTRTGVISAFLEGTNVFGRRNICCVDNIILRPRPDGTVFVDTRYSYWLPFVPSFGVTWTFGAT